MQCNWSNDILQVKTTSPKKYSVRPNVGICMPKSVCDFTGKEFLYINVLGLYIAMYMNVTNEFQSLSGL